MNQNNPIEIIVQAKDWIFGKISGIEYKDEGGILESDLPDGERQSAPKFDTQGCVSWSVLDCVETEANKNARKGNWSKRNIEEMEKLGFCTNRRFNFSDRYLAQESDTTRQGNTVQKVIDTLRDWGMVGENDWPFTQDMDWNTFYSESPKEIDNKAQKFHWYFDVVYEWVITNNQPNALGALRYHTKQAPVLITTPVCPTWQNGLVNACSRTIIDHATMCWSVDEYMNILDHYEPYKKKLALDYSIPWAMKIVVTPKNDYLHTELRYGQSSPEVKKLQEFLNLSPDTAVAQSGMGSKGYETNYYGQLTANAVLRLQKKYGGFSAWELMWYKGTVMGPKSKALINRLAKSIQ